ncbi:hypothetical protein [Cytobacillus firmus]|uniref:hypothetical protein n=1 Tax=Cytobacillus firmus TaxID=1399 RepID=UPI002161DF0C|nr:hypothetical protein [Cytobacillus firmus]MCS0670653.1 hypothetical protein [Cytobacillus firmus]
MLLRTGKGENGKSESEPGASSDRKRRKRGERVRTGCFFGQEKEKTGRASPNRMLLRTEKGENGESESEPDASSDRKRRKREERFRTGCFFGQEKEKSGSVSPNPEHIRTEKGENGDCESEPVASSDRKRRKREKRVRTWCIFGQKKEKSGRASPNPVHIRTEKGEIGECESEPGTRIGKHNPKLMQKGVFRWIFDY